MNRFLVLYGQNGKDSLDHVTRYAEFDLDFKLKVVLSVINDGLSLREAEKTYSLRTKAVIQGNRTIKIFRTATFHGKPYFETP